MRYKLETVTGDLPDRLFQAASGVTRALIGVNWGGGGVYSYIRVLPDEFLLKSVVSKFISKEISRAEHEYEYTTPPPPRINALVTPLQAARMFDELEVQQNMHVYSLNSLSLFQIVEIPCMFKKNVRQS